MPITKQVIKRMKQAKVRTERNNHYKSHMKSMVRLILEYVKSNEKDKAEKILTKVVSAIDTCAKKKIIHERNASHKKSRIQRALNSLDAAREGKKEAVKKEVKEEEVKKEEKKADETK